ncbi:MAG: NAD-dependent epimerase/dehydratase family protein [Planctomycetota bacterium]
MLVTGGAGFIGSNIALRLAETGHDVVATDSFASATWKNLAKFTGDVLTLRSRDDLNSIVKLAPYDAIFHQASITGVIDTTTGASLSEAELQQPMLLNNVEMFRGLLDHAAETGARMIWASSCSVYGQGPVPMKEDQPKDPLNSYAFSKLTMERMAERYAPKLAHPIVALRYSNVYGPGEAHKGKLASMIHQLALQMRAGKRPRIFTDGSQKRDFVYIDDVVQANVKALDAKEAGAFNVGAGQSWSFNEIVATLNDVLGTDLAPDYFENPYGFTQDWTETNLDKSRSVLGYQPEFDIAAGVKAYADSGTLGIA